MIDQPDQPERLTLTYEDAERLYGEVMSGILDIIYNLGGDVDDDRVNEIYQSLDIAMRDIYAYAEPPKR